MRAVVQECLAVAEGDAVSVVGDTWEEVLRIARTMPAQFSSTAQDLARGKRSEIDHLNGLSSAGRGAGYRDARQSHLAHVGQAAGRHSQATGDLPRLHVARVAVDGTERGY